MRKEFYLAVSERLLSIEGNPIKHVDLWNNNVEYIEQETNWPRPAVFVEFRPVVWERMTTRGANEYQARAEVRLHIVTDWLGGASSEQSEEYRQEAIEALDLSEQIHAALLGLTGEHFGDVEIQVTLTNHNHEELVENVEVYLVTFTRSIEKRTVKVRVPVNVTTKMRNGQEMKIVGPVSSESGTK